MGCKSDEYYDSVLHDCRHCSLVCDPPYSPPEHQEECLFNCPGYRKTEAPVVAAVGPVVYILITLTAVVMVISVIMIVLWRQQRLRCRRAPVIQPVALADGERLVEAIPESGPGYLPSSPGIRVHGNNNQALCTSTSRTVR